ncbi:uncharacterized protein LOC126788532 [Argentina anserina]|uniref:uncharacterized protein LOC126788531 n=1 Tax=Argentina anserina TaxID=57926 RepID=UPI00217681DC|nr:uncharacterized protein LOC126788531 [Potentilla anserina]XP_050370490.1 uncharacterized protein LOC126788532 [Potentilla anserina]
MQRPELFLQQRHKSKKPFSFLHYRTMAQLERPQRHGDAEATMASEQRKLTVNPSMEHYLRGTDFMRSSSPTSLSSPVGSHDAEEDHNHHPKKSVLTKVKEKAKKLKHSLSTKKKHHDNDSHETEVTTRSWSANLDDNEVEEEDAEYLGAPMYKSEMAPEAYRETAKLASPVLSEKHILSSSYSQNSENNKDKSPSSNQIVAESVITKLPNEIFTGIVLTRTLSSKETATGTAATKPRSPNKTLSETNSPNKPHSPNRTVTESGDTKTLSPKKTITETVSEKLGAGYATVSEKLGTGYATVSEKLGTGYATTSEKLGTGYNIASEKLGTGYNTASEKLGPAYATVSDATHAIASKIESLTVSPPFPTNREIHTASRPDPSKIKGLTVTAPPPAQYITAREAPQALSASAVEHNSSTSAALESPQPLSAPAGPGKAEQRWDKGVSVKEYLIHKFEPGEDERALSQVISDVMSPRKNPGEAGVVEKVKGAISSLLRNDESPRATTISQSPFSPSQSILPPTQSALSSSPRIPISTNAYEVVEEENQGRVLQAN